MARYFRLEQAEGLLPEIERSLRELTSLKRRFEEAERDSRATSERVAMLGGAFPDRDTVVAQRARRETLAARLRESIQAVQQRGWLVKDLDAGLVDFPTLFHGQEVYLCWKLGEPAIRFWHGIEEGFRGRKPIDQEFLDNHRGE